jgi:hypothetical protein
VPVGGNVRVNYLGEENGKAFGDDRGEEIAFPRRENILQERPLGAVSVLVGYQKREVLEVLETLQPQSNGGRPVDLHGNPIGAEEPNEEIYRRLRFQGENSPAPLQRLAGQNLRVLRLDQPTKMSIISLLNLPDPVGNLVQIKMTKILPVGRQEFFMGIQVEALIGRPGIALSHSIQEFEKIGVYRINHNKRLFVIMKA